MGGEDSFCGQSLIASSGELTYLFSDWPVFCELTEGGMAKGGKSKAADPITPAQWAAAKQAYYAPGYLEPTEGLS